MPPVQPALPPTPQSAPAGKEKDPSRKRTLFGGISIFRSKSSPPKEEAAPAPPKPRQRSTSQTTLNAVAASVRKIVAPHPNMSSAQVSRKGAPTPTQQSVQQQQQQQQVQQEQRTPRTSQEDRAYRRPPSPERQTILAPTPRAAVPDPNMLVEGGLQKFHSQFRLVSRKYRAVSDASVEAQDGTVVSQFSIQSVLCTQAIFAGKHSDRRRVS